MEQNSKLNNDDFSKNTFQHLMNFFILPEINKRQAKGELPIPVELIKVQIVFYPDERRHQIRINDEVSAVAELKLKKGVGKKKGEPIIQHETEGIGEIQLTQKDDPNCTHVLLLNIGEKWLLSYDFRYNKALSKEFIKRSNEFIECAEFSYQKKYWGSFVDNLFSASELLATSILLIFPDPSMRKKRSHHMIKNRFYRFVNVGNLTFAYSKTFNKLVELRINGRYLRREFKIADQETEEYLNCIKMLKNDIEKIMGSKNTPTK